MGKIAGDRPTYIVSASSKVKCRIVGNFREVQIFVIFATYGQNAKKEPRNMKPRKFEHVNFWKFLPQAFCALVSFDLTSDDGTIALF